MMLKLFAVMLPVAIGINNTFVPQSRGIYDGQNPAISYGRSRGQFDDQNRGIFPGYNILSPMQWGILWYYQRRYPVNESDVTFSLYLKRNPKERIPLNESTYNEINKKYPIQMVIHGWRESSSTPWVQNMTTRLLRIVPYNVILVDYSKIAFQPVILASSHVAAVGKLVGKFLVMLDSNYSLPTSKQTLIAYGIGAHVAGNAGREIINSGKELNRILALDAASLFFECPPLFQDQALNSTHAKTVEAIHTDRTFFGYKKPLATIDFFPNDGLAPQPGCPSILKSINSLDLLRGGDDLLCSHRKSYMYVLSSLRDGKFLSVKCNSWRNYTTGACNNNTIAVMGAYERFSSKSGKFYLRTKAEYPYAEQTYI